MTRPGGENEDVVRWLGQGELLAALGLFEVLELGVALPFALASVADDAVAPELTHRSAASLADMRLSVKVPLFRGPFSVSGRAVITLPTGDDENFLGVGYWTLTPSVVLGYRLGETILAGELGYRMRRKAVLGTLEQNDEVHLALGVNHPLTSDLSLLAEVQGRLGIGGAPVPIEVGGGVRLSPVLGMNVDVGLGTGLHSGYGSPDFRAFAIFRYASERESCEAGPEDFDGFEDGDYCADLDNDGDGLEDSEDECPNDAEDLDEFLDLDGCPDTDNDADGILDAADQCPLLSEDIDGYEDTDGCPDPDNDQDGVTDGLDECPMEPEDRDDYQDGDGCPEPGPDRVTVTVTDTRILISDRIYFDFDRDTIRPVSMPLLDKVADAVRQLPADRRVSVDGYTDDAGDPRYNLDLSYRRCRAVVEYLVGRGIRRGRLTFVGHGIESPVAPNDSPEGRSLNRRVEFNIIRGRR